MGWERGIVKGQVRYCLVLGGIPPPEKPHEGQVSEFVRVRAWLGRAAVTTPSPERAPLRSGMGKEDIQAAVIMYLPEKLPTNPALRQELAGLTVG